MCSLACSHPTAAESAAALNMTMFSVLLLKVTGEITFLEANLCINLHKFKSNIKILEYGDNSNNSEQKPRDEDHIFRSTIFETQYRVLTCYRR